jgi:hypothetical protein
MSWKLIFPAHLIFFGLPAMRPASTLMADASTANTKDLITLYVIIRLARKCLSPFILCFPSGDSYSTTDFNIEGSYPSATDPLGNPELPGQTSDGSFNWIGSLTSHYYISLTLSFNFAVGGATTDSNLILP